MSLLVRFYFSLDRYRSLEQKSAYLVLLNPLMFIWRCVITLASMHDEEWLPVVRS